MTGKLPTPYGSLYKGTIRGLTFSAFSVSLFKRDAVLYGVPAVGVQIGFFLRDAGSFNNQQSVAELLISGNPIGDRPAGPQMGLL
jgi:hypothetical protein